MTYIVVDVESDGPAPGKYSMVSFGAVVVEPSLGRTFFGEMRPISDYWIPEALAVSGYTREQTLAFSPPQEVMSSFVLWIRNVTAQGTEPIFVSDNNGYDFGFINYYLWHFVNENPFGHSSRNISDLYRGMKKDVHSSFRGLVTIPHTHDPVQDARGHAEALLKMQHMGLKL